jgi:hypothetical protein
LKWEDKEIYPPLDQDKWFLIEYAVGAMAWKLAGESRALLMGIVRSKI